MGSFHAKLAQIELQKNCQQNYQHYKRDNKKHKLKNLIPIFTLLS